MTKQKTLKITKSESYGKPKQDTTYCKEDYLGQHCWKHVGVCKDKNAFVEIFKCMQCKKFSKKKMEFVENGNAE